MGLVEKLFGSYSKRELKRIKPILDQVLALEEDYKKMSEEELRGQTEYLKGKLEDGETLDTILPEAFAACREAARRVLGTPHYPVQIIGGIVLHQGRIAEMRTGEGKTQTCLLPAYLNALTGKGVHIVTVNDYLAKRDSEWMGKVYRYMGLSVGLIIHDMDNDARREAYNCDITYGTNNEIGFDYLRDNMVTYKEQQVQRPFNYAIVDEVDSILIDEARTPLIISGKGDESTDLYQIVDRFARTLTMNKVVELDAKVDNDNLEGDYIVDEKAKTATLTPAGVKKAEAAFRIANLMDPENMTLLHHINQAIKAHGIMHNEEDYVVKDGEVIIVDEFTGRLMYGRRYNEGLHQAIEAKEGVKIAHESKTLATITFQNLFRLYNKLSGMTGTALTEEGEFREIYKLDVIEIPTNRPVQRIDHEDVVYKNEKGKYNAVIEQIIECHKKGQPVLVGTITIDKSEMLSSMLKRRGIPHEVLNAKYHEKEAEIVAQAGKKGAVTIATNMAGRGTDIKLGGNEEYLAKHDMRRMGFSDELIAEADAFGETDDAEILNARQTFKDLVAKHKKVIAVEAEEVRKAGGLFILGTERHESRRIDNQLRGRAGRQGDPGESRFFLSLEDDIMRLFGGERIQNMMEALKIDENQPIETKMLTNSIESAQKKVEGRNFAIRRNVLQFDDVMNRQREIIYSQRAKVLDGENLRSYIMDMLKDNITETVNQYLSDEVIHDNWNVDGLRNHYLGFFTTPEDFHYTPDELANKDKKDFVDALYEKAVAKYEEKEQEIGVERMREVERVVLLRNVDSKWMDHIDAMDELKKGIYLRSYGQRDPVVEYRIEGFDMFDAMVAAIREDTVKMLLTVRLRNPNEELRREQVANPTSESHGDEGGRVQTQAVRAKSPRKS
ncbi:MAG TPA: preprotein translocase subunit SecA [Candidatus Merdivicinus intestinigallinarum]|nr:preprotein translocase subunit SecA [Candidatus Merdivicinus intestinigallinarum]